ncbi:indole-3-glycerol phosphate synthase TrpC [Roseospirillum parvum]|uniref:Indole-3-glycerol phosphate synthase n=1 Tax=Roseospirillum parvum TaxID=83401 RepID=A0A1G7U9C7_9PROT|nr:indole-3-glycerol phosphate synthase TrpC [Roseospirillum parvum]SDG44235.1 indole-3-glycerol phosphate synthase [Roseospirillum parvum]
MTDVLQRICATTAEEVAQRKKTCPAAELEAAIAAAAPPRGFARALAAKVEAGGYGLIAEIKQASPSAGLIRPDFNPAELAKSYAAGGAACLSVLTEGPNFQGHPDHLRAARAAVDLPVLRKDFMVDPWQIGEARAMGADAILLILAALDDTLAAEMEAAAFDLGMDVLAEVHDLGELERALSVLKTPLIGINNRNLKTLKTDLAVTEALAPLVPAERDLVAESGLHAPADLARMAAVGARRFLIGESLMRQPDPGAAAGALLAEPLPEGAAGGL